MAKWLARHGRRVSSAAHLKSVDDAARETQRRLDSLLVVVIFAFTSLAVLDTPAMIALQRRRELALLRLAGATVRQVAAMTAALAFAGAQLPTRLVLRGRAAG